VVSLALGGYFKGSRGLIKKLGELRGGGKLALDISEASTKLLTQNNSSPELKES
jgi:hypothetical protein